jgi:transcriptional regulator of heat shock response
MVKHVDTKEREQDILNLIVESYIKESKPVSSTHLCEKYKLPYSSTTVRNVMESLEEDGFVSHIHTSSGRVPTKKGFKNYIEHIKEEEFIKNYPVTLDFYSRHISGIEEAMGYTLDLLAELSGYTSLVAISGKDDRFFFRGTRFILQQPEFKDMERLRNLFYTLEVRINELQDLLFHSLDERIKVLIGDEIGFDEMADCSLVVSGSRENKLSFALALLGPMRMDYVKAASCLYSIKNELKRAVEEFL